MSKRNSFTSLIHVEHLNMLEEKDTFKAGLETVRVRVRNHKDCTSVERQEHQVIHFHNLSLMRLISSYLQFHMGNPDNIISFDLAALFHIIL